MKISEEMGKELKESGWLCIATEGRSVDGREMMREWLSSAAQNYNSDFYSAVIWNEHNHPLDRAYQLNLGLVLELKTEEVNGKLKLFAKLAANKFLLMLNEDNQKLFCSVEITQDFPEVGQFYLTGLAVTDQPALPGLSQLKFSNKEHTPIHTGLHIFSLSNETEQPTGSNTMTEEEIQALKDTIAAQAEKIEALEAALAEKDAKKAEDLTEEITELAEEITEQAETVAEEVADEISKEEFAALKKDNIALKKQFNDLSRKFSRAMSFSTTPTPDLKPTVGVDLSKFV